MFLQKTTKLATPAAERSPELMDYSFCQDDLYNSTQYRPKQQQQQLDLDLINEEDLSEYRTSSSPTLSNGVKSKITSIWNNVKYNWNVYLRKNKTHFERTQVICLLGKFYFEQDSCTSSNGSSFCATSPSRLTSLNDYYLVQNDLKMFEQDVYTRLWFTYRKDFVSFNGTSITSDMGWGCMLRSAQMMLAQGFLMHFLGRDWSLFRSNLHADIVLHREIVSWFLDRPSNKCPFGLHRLLDIAINKMGKKVGDWFGPVSVTLMMRDALNKSRDYIPLLDDSLQIYVAQDCCIYKKEIYDLCLVQGSSDQKFIPLILLVSVRLGGEEFNEIYVETLKFFLRMKECLGIIGGKPKHSLYFIGYQGDKIIYLDPHVCQKNVDSSIDDDLSSFHCCTPGKTQFSKLDPSFALGFYYKTKEDFENFCNTINQSNASQFNLNENEKIHPIFSIFDQAPIQSQSIDIKLMSLEDVLVSPERRKSKSRLNTRRKSHLHNNTRRDSTATIEDFVMINSL